MRIYLQFDSLESLMIIADACDVRRSCGVVCRYYEIVEEIVS